MSYKTLLGRTNLNTMPTEIFPRRRKDILYRRDAVSARPFAQPCVFGAHAEINSLSCKFNELHGPSHGKGWPRDGTRRPKEAVHTLPREKADQPSLVSCALTFPPGTNGFFKYT